MKYTTVACAVIDAIDPALLAWFAFHRVIGVERFLIYMRSKAPDGVLSAGLADDVSVCPWPEALPVESAYLHASRRMREQADWLICLPPDHFLTPLNGKSLSDQMATYGGGQGGIGLQPQWQVSMRQIALSIPADPGYAAGQVPLLKHPPQMAASWRPAQVYLVRPRVVTGFDDGPQLASGWALVNEQGERWAPEPRLKLSMKRMRVDCFPLGLPAGVGKALLAGEAQTSLPEWMKSAWLAGCERQRCLKLSLALKPLAGRPEGSQSLGAEGGLEALVGLLAPLAAEHSQPRALVLGDTPVALAVAIVQAGYGLDVVEAHPAQASLLRARLDGFPSVRMTPHDLAGLILDGVYQLAVLRGGKGYQRNRLLGDTDNQRLRAALTPHLSSGGLLLQVEDDLDLACREAGSEAAEFLVLPGWASPRALCRAGMKEQLLPELTLAAGLEHVAAGEPGLRIIGPAPQMLRGLSGLVGFAGADALMRRLYEWRLDSRHLTLSRTVSFFSALGDVSKVLGAEIAPVGTVAVAQKPGRRWLSLLRDAAAAGDMEGLLAGIRRWMDFLSAHADECGQLEGHWLDALPAQVRESRQGELEFVIGEWRHKRDVDIRLVTCLGLWQLISDPAVRWLFPDARPEVAIKWLTAVLNRNLPPLWLDTTSHIHRLTGLERARVATPRQDAYGAQLPDLSLRPAVVELLQHRLEQQAALPKFLVLVQGPDSEMDSAAVLATRRSLEAMDYPVDFEVVLTGHSEAGNLANQAIRDSDADWVWLLEAGDQLDPSAAWILAERIAALPQLKACYVDEDLIIEGERSEPIFKPDFNLDLLRGYAYVGRGVIFERAAMLEVGGLRPGLAEAASGDLIFRLAEHHGPVAIGHVAEVLCSATSTFDQWLKRPGLVAHWPAVVAAHLQRLGIDHRLEPGPLASSVRVRYQHVSRPLVSIIIPTRNQLPLLMEVVDSLLAKTAYPHYELLVVDNGSDDADACRYLDGLDALASEQIRVLRYAKPFNYSAMNNQAALQARGEYLLLLNNDTAVLEPEWLDAMLEHAQRPEVGVVGAKLLFPDGRIQHAGVVMGLDKVAGHPFIGSASEAGGYMHRLKFDQNYSVVTGACLLIRAEVFRQVGGLDEASLAVSYNDVDLCLRVQQAGYLTVWTPHARVMHHGSVSQKKLDPDQQTAKSLRFKGEQEVMYRRWLPYMAADPAYNRNLSLQGAGFELDPYRHIAWQPFVERVLPRIVSHPADRTGCGHYRVRQPFVAMQRENLIAGTVTEALLSPPLLARFEAEAIILQRQHTDAQREAMRSYLKFSDAFKVYELDDYMFNLPMKSVHRGAMPKDLRKQLRQAVAMTDRFVVSTQVLAEQFADMHDDIRVVLNRLPFDWWSGLKPERRVGARPRVGWGGGSSHTGDLELIADVVRELADEVDWVFFGMCPDKLKPYVKEFYTGVPIEQYPAKLASLNLDLALAPLEDNLFNHCKSNLRLLEYGACGFPVVCSDLITYRGDLPVTRVKNRFKDWVAAIRMHVADLDATAAMGDALRDAVMRDWTLTGQNLLEWRDAWLPD